MVLARFDALCGGRGARAEQGDHGAINGSAPGDDVRDDARSAPPAGPTPAPAARPPFSAALPTLVALDADAQTATLAAWRDVLADYPRTHRTQLPMLAETRIAGRRGCAAAHVRAAARAARVGARPVCVPGHGLRPPRRRGVAAARGRAHRGDGGAAPRDSARARGRARGRARARQCGRAAPAAPARDGPCERAAFVGACGDRRPARPSAVREHVCARDGCGRHAGRGPRAAARRRGGRRHCRGACVCARAPRARRRRAHAGAQLSARARVRGVCGPGAGAGGRASRSVRGARRGCACARAARGAARRPCARCSAAAARAPARAGDERGGPRARVGAAHAGRSRGRVPYRAHACAYAADAHVCGAGRGERAPCAHAARVGAGRRRGRVAAAQRGDVRGGRRRAACGAGVFATGRVAPARARGAAAEG
ncbi:hypothetical protein MSPP1_003210b, partial [Malassezia sp. CBS 17886]